MQKPISSSDMANKVDASLITLKCLINALEKQSSIKPELLRLVAEFEAITVSADDKERFSAVMSIVRNNIEP